MKLNKYRIVDVHYNKYLGTIEASNEREAMEIAKRKWPENVPYLTVQLRG